MRLFAHLPLNYIQFLQKGIDRVDYKVLSLSIMSQNFGFYVENLASWILDQSDLFYPIFEHVLVVEFHEYYFLSRCFVNEHVI